MYEYNNLNITKFKGCSTFQLVCNLTRKYDVIGYYSYTERW